MFTAEECSRLKSLKHWRDIDVHSDRDLLWRFWDVVFQDRVRTAIDSTAEPCNIEYLQEVFDDVEDVSYHYMYEKDSIDEDGVDHDPHTASVSCTSFVLPHGSRLSFDIYVEVGTDALIIYSLYLRSLSVYLYNDTKPIYVPATAENFFTIYRTLCDTINDLRQYYQDTIALPLQEEKRREALTLKCAEAILFDSSSHLHPYYYDGVNTQFGTVNFRLNISTLDTEQVLSITLAGFNYQMNGLWTLRNPSINDLQQIIPELNAAIAKIEALAKTIEDDYPF